MIKKPHQVSAISLINENGINSTLNKSVPAITNAILIVDITTAIQKPGIIALNELATPDGTESGIFICQLCLIVKR